MKIISHRANINGPDAAKENTLEQIDFVHNLGYDVEIHVWFINNN